MKEAQNRQEWERTRILAAISIQPHTKKKITPKQLIPLPWDKKKHTADRSEAPKLTAEEQRQRFENLANRLGDEINK